MEPGPFNKLLEEYGLSHDEAFAIARVLVATGSHDSEQMFLGKKMLLTLSRVGHAYSTMTIVAQAVLQAKRKPGVLKSSEIAFSRAHLRQLVSEGSSYKAMVVEGNVANAEGDENRAISLWTQAMAAAVEESEAEAMARGKSGNARDPNNPTLAEYLVSQLQLSSPWIELLLVHMDRSKRRGLDWAHEIAQCEWAMRIGCEQSDPDAHYYAATYNTTQDGYSSEWLYHITKAASSGHWKAAHELAEFYTNTGWKYLDDEPPDDMKPTPFDSYPAGRPASWWEKALEFVGLKQTSTRDSKRDLFHTAAYPSSDAGRFRLAMMWLEVPLRQHYAPSFLHKAKMCMEKRLWSKSNTPKSALQLRDDRYAYASREDYEKGKLIDERWEYESEDDREARKPSLKTSSPEPEGEPNPYYDLEEAKKALREVFWAYRAHEMVKKDLATYESRRLRGLSTKGLVEEDFLQESLYRRAPFHVWKWLVFPEVRDKYLPIIERIYSEAKGICDSEGWDLYDEHNALVYKARRK
ncbi:hypothetical protein DOTSEDRAFT_71012 [Lecanosticta acicola]|uniref:Uncharacterized protein n=1 Tax=Lecanosticta acicola TaxID=111012 RepID=A0AAI9EDU8_9PEZI|nr:hypothetical protein DOTSEDRAFT_71012 [Lecanosticta acicola]